VYDITEWVEGHPGGSVILRAAGGALEPYWSIFSFHQRPDIMEMLDDLKIGEVSAKFVSDLFGIDSNAAVVSFSRSTPRILLMAKCHPMLLKIHSAMIRSVTRDLSSAQRSHVMLRLHRTRCYYGLHPSRLSLRAIICM
jgi:hypothetical protein